MRKPCLADFRADRLHQCDSEIFDRDRKRGQLWQEQDVAGEQRHQQQVVFLRRAQCHVVDARQTLEQLLLQQPDQPSSRSAQQPVELVEGQPAQCAAASNSQIRSNALNTANGERFSCKLIQQYCRDGAESLIVACLRTRILNEMNNTNISC